MPPILPMNEFDGPEDERAFIDDDEAPQHPEYDDILADNQASTSEAIWIPDDLQIDETETAWDDALRISLLKQYAYCARIAYYETCTPDIRPTTYKMLAGEEAHEQERTRAARRTLFAYQVKEGQRHFDVRLTSARLGLTGIIDEVVLTNDHAIIVDYKLAEFVGANHEIQLTAYALLVEEAFARPVEHGFIYLLESRSFEKRPITQPFRNSVIEMIGEINHIRLNEYMPPPTKQIRKCQTCEFRRLCIDI